MRDITAMKINRYDVPVHPLEYDKPNMMFGQWCRAIDVERLEAQNTELLEVLKRLASAVCHLGLTEYHGSLAVTVEAAFAAIDKAEGGQQ